MVKEVVIFDVWKSLEDFEKLRSLAEKNLSDVETFVYLLFVKHKKQAENLPKMEGVCFLTKKDFSIFNKVKSPLVKDILKCNKTKVLIVGSTESASILKKVIKNTDLVTFGIENGLLPKRAVSIVHEKGMIDRPYFEKINKYLIKIKL